MSFDRRKTQRLYLEILREPNPEDYPLDLETIFDVVFPRRKQTVIPQANRKDARAAIEELVDSGILVRDHLKDRKLGDFFVINPTPIDGKTADQRFDELPHVAADLSHREQLAVVSVIVLDAIMLFFFYSYFMPQQLVTRFLGTVTLTTGVLALAGLRLNESKSLWDAIWDRKNYLPLGLGTVALMAALIVGVLTPYQVMVTPGTTILVDGAPYATVSRLTDGSQTDWNRGHRELIWVPWGVHEIKVTKPYHLVMNSSKPEFSSSLVWPTHRTADPALTAYIKFASQLAAHGTKESPIPTIVRSTELFFERHSRTRTATESNHVDMPNLEVIPDYDPWYPSLKVTVIEEFDSATNSNYIAATCTDMHSNTTQRRIISLVDSPEGVSNAMRELCRFVLQELAMVSPDVLNDTKEQDWKTESKQLADLAKPLIQNDKVRSQLMQTTAATMEGLKLAAANADPKTIDALAKEGAAASRAASKQVVDSFKKLHSVADDGKTSWSPYLHNVIQDGKQVIDAIGEQTRLLNPSGAETEAAIDANLNNIVQVATNAPTTGAHTLTSAALDNLDKIVKGTSNAATLEKVRLSRKTITDYLESKSKGQKPPRTDP